jgi:hypothetical protein
MKTCPSKYVVWWGATFKGNIYIFLKVLQKTFCIAIDKRQIDTDSIGEGPSMGDRSIMYHLPKQDNILSLGHTHTSLSGFVSEFIVFGEQRTKSAKWNPCIISLVIWLRINIFQLWFTDVISAYRKSYKIRYLTNDKHVTTTFLS